MHYTKTNFKKRGFCKVVGSCTLLSVSPSEFFTFLPVGIWCSFFPSQNCAPSSKKTLEKANLEGSRIGISLLKLFSEMWFLVRTLSANQVPHSSFVQWPNVEKTRTTPEKCLFLEEKIERRKNNMKESVLSCKREISGCVQDVFVPEELRKLGKGATE